MRSMTEGLVTSRYFLLSVQDYTTGKNLLNLRRFLLTLKSPIKKTLSYFLKTVCKFLLITLRCCEMKVL